MDGAGSQEQGEQGEEGQAGEGGGAGVFDGVDLHEVLVRICRSPRNDGVLDGALLELLLTPEHDLARRDTDGETWLPRSPAVLGELLGAGRKHVEHAVARLLGHGLVHLGVDADGTPWVAPDTGAIVAAIDRTT